MIADGREVVLSSAAMSDLLDGARDLRRKLYHLEVLLEVEKGGRDRSWFAGKTPSAAERAAAIKRLRETGLIEAAAAPVHFRVTPEGREFLKDVRTKVGTGDALNWTRADEIDFSKL
jgi:DNA-binding PadR family transcriptional regulator